MRVCHRCNAPVESPQVGRRDECAACGADLHCCLNCRFYDAASPRSCREPQAEPPRDNDRSNFCDYFELAAAGPKAEGESEADRARAAFEAIFKKR